MEENTVNPFRKENKAALKLSREEKAVLMKEIQDFFLNERDEQIGLIAAETVLDFFLENIGLFIYNKALDDAKLWFMKSMEDMEFNFDLLYK